MLAPFMVAEDDVPVPPTPRWFRWASLVVLLLATIVRLGYLADLRATPWWGHLVVDPEYYDAWARKIAAGDWLGTRAFYMDPLYPYVLAALYGVAGRDLLLARLLNVACSVGACAATMLLGRRVGGPLVGILAGLGLAFYEPDVFHTGEIDKTSLSMLLVAGFLWLFAARGVGGARTLAAGLALGLAVLTRANLLVFLPLGALVLARAGTSRSDGIGKAMLFAAGFALALAPVTWRNHRVAGEWTLATTQGGQNFYTGNNPANPYGAYGVVPFVRANPHFEEEDFRHEAETRAGRSLTPREVSAFWYRAALAHAADDPTFALRAVARKAVLFWNDFEISDSQDQYLLERDSAVLRSPLLGFGAILPLAVLGAIAGLGRRGRGRPAADRSAVALLAGFVLVYAASVVAFFIFARYRIQVVPALLPLAALGTVEIAACVAWREWRRFGLAVAVLGAGAALAFQHVGIFARDHPVAVELRLRHLADGYLGVGDAERAIAALVEAVPHCPHGCPWALKDLYEAYAETGRAAQGEAYFARFVREHPEQRDAPQYLADLRVRAAASK
ncbi:MAG: glycosyltransferase family 39 protein [Deltaproteobacteria bacterium]|nr:glycosyltransferase family 39 protein [Deltaproteobacteria bacterium]